MTKVSTLEARKNLAEIINSAQYGKDRIVLTRHGKAVATVISMEDLELLELLEDRLDLMDAKAILEDDDSEFVDWDTVKETI
ncbi:MAG: type II toxin-antitoxin system Phd/YefM family antitoxin [Candidatus Marinimicrobia bacterium]|nr:type II toxin-antitoxin system Phd/YefM family antitoxin [Candidatus Neomarinimicrobiota bacterium]MBL7009806.1 type II toxin-antitoxin system Phd/YefM family antitoxin [Candidatus Neomarinimicrobiota bacterium]MBL7029790.1 type II toxin-antitoxin system Phd/YefM family antitoxin [Candidatus Neomarinimicrobiota bacterium]